MGGAIGVRVKRLVVDGLAVSDMRQWGVYTTGGGKGADLSVINSGLTGGLAPSLRVSGLVALGNGSDPLGSGSVYGGGVQVSGRLTLESATLSGNLLRGVPAA